MRRSTALLLFVAGMMCFTMLPAKDGKIPILGKTIRKRDVPVHPIEKLMGGGLKVQQPSLRANNKLLVILAEFQEDDDPQTTGNGKFLLEDDDYPITLGAPPHDHEYFTKIMESVRYYYLEVSQGFYDLDCDIYPRDGSFYELPQEMKYYNPPGASSSLMLERFEEYFRDVLQTADADSTVNFSDYGHYMVIHAGADWQHDIQGDSPGDIPSFFITIGDGKEVAVDNGAKYIKHLCNVPEMITQDTSSYTEGGIEFYDGYGVTNSVTAHEFGHTLGFVDLYNTFNFRPAVGYWDIMDSGGSTILTMSPDDDGDGIPDGEKYFYIEGGIPALPGAFHKELVWNNEFRANGLLKDISEFDLSQPIEVIAAGKQFSGDIGPNQAYIVKIPLSDTEYILIENRQTDHDEDGVTTMVGDNGANSQVIFYPTGYDNDDADEYDFALPGWNDENNNSYGGGLIMWHVDEKIIYQQGTYESDGEFVSNFAANSVNTKYKSRGVKIIEADGLEDIGNVYSQYWYGTVYEPFYKYKPLLDTNGYFTGWDINLFNNRISSTTQPALQTNAGEPSMFEIYDIDSGHYSRPFHIPPEIVSFRFKAQMFDNISYVPFVEIDSVVTMGRAGLSDFLPNSTISEFPVFSNHGVNFISHFYDGGSLDDWNDMLTQVPLSFKPTQTPIAFDYDEDGYDEWVVAAGKDLHVLKTAESFGSITFTSEVTSPPFPLVAGNENSFAVCTGNFIYKFKGGSQDFAPHTDALPIGNASLAADDRYLYAFSEGVLYKIDYQSEFSIENEITMPFEATSYDPIAFYDTANVANNAVFMLSDEGDLYRIRDGQVKRIFEIYPYTTAATTNLSIGAPMDDGRVYLFFGAGNTIFAIDTEGVMADGFPARLEDLNIMPGGYPAIVELLDQSIVLMPGERQGYFAVNANGDYQPFFSLGWNGKPGLDFFHWEKDSARLNYIYNDFYEDPASQSEVCRIGIASIDEVYENPIDWNGYRNGGYGCFYGAITYSPSADQRLSVIAYPNPVRSGQLRLKVEGAQAKIDVKLYNIAGDMICDRSYEADESIRIDTRNMASGLYFGIVESDGQKKTIRFGIEN